MNEINVFFLWKKTEQQPDCLNESELLTRSLHLTFKLCATQEPRLDMATALRVFSNKTLLIDELTWSCQPHHPSDISFSLSKTYIWLFVSLESLIGKRVLVKEGRFRERKMKGRICRMSRHSLLVSGLWHLVVVVVVVGIITVLLCGLEQLAEI